MPFTHTPALPILIWCIWALPFTLWDTAFLYLRPHSLPNQKWHQYFAYGGTYTIWANVDYSYGEPGWQDQDGFVLAQSLVNLLEVALYVAYVRVVAGGKGGGLWAWNKERRSVDGRSAAWAVLVGLAAGTVTATKTFLYFMREILSGLKYTGHNGWWAFLTTWSAMNLLYITASGSMIFIFGKEILNGLSASTNSGPGSESSRKPKRR